MSSKPDVIANKASCADDHDPNSLDMAIAKQKISEMIKPVNGFESVAIRNALNRTLSADVLSTIDVPAYTNSAMDGYAIKYSDIQQEGVSSLEITGVAYAGKPFTGSIQNGQCVRIMTGAMLPEGVDTVIMQEHVEVKDNCIHLSATHQQGQNIRHAGEDLKIGAPALHKGTAIKPADIGLIASLGITEVTVSRNLRVAFFSTGDELRSIGETLQQGQIYDSNRYTLYCMLSNLGVEIMDMGIIPDDPGRIQQAFQTAADEADLLITTGGVSVGDADYVKQTLEDLGEVNFWKIAMKPGRPLAVGKVNNAYFFGLPGNPVSAMVTFYQFVQPAIRQLMGQTKTEPHMIRIKTVSNLKKRPGRVDFQRGILFINDDGEHVVKTTGNQGSHVLSSMSEANCFIVLAQDSGSIKSGEYVDVQPFYGVI